MSLAALDAALYAALSATQWITASGPTTARPFALVGPECSEVGGEVRSVAGAGGGGLGRWSAIRWGGWQEGGYERGNIR